MKLARPDVFHPRIVLAGCPQLVEGDGDDDWGTGSNGRGDVSSSNENIGGNSSSAPGQNK